MQDQGKKKEARKYYLQALKLRPDLALAHYNLSFLMSQEGDWKGAVAELEATLRYRPAFPGAHKYLALMWADQSRYDKAMFHLENRLTGVDG